MKRPEAFQGGDAAPDHYVDDHRRAWGFLFADDQRLFEKLCLGAAWWARG